MNKEIAKEKILHGDFPEALQQMFLGNEDPFDCGFKEPYYVFNQGAPIINESFIPLFQNGAFTYFYDEDNKLFFAFHLESPNEKHIYGNSVQCLWAGIILNFFDDETEISELKNLSNKIGFLYPEKLYNTMQEYFNTNSDYETTKNEILRSCNI